MTDTIVSLITYAVTCLVCAGAAYLFHTDLVNVIAFTALAMGVNALGRAD